MKRMTLLLMLCLLLAGCAASAQIPAAVDGTNVQSGTDTPERSGLAPAARAAEPDLDQESETAAVTICVPNTVPGWAGWQDYLMDLEVEIVDSPQGLISALSEQNAIPNDVKVNSFTQTGKTCILDLSEAFRPAVAALEADCAGENEGQWHMGLDSVVDTFLRHYELDTITLLIDGQRIPGLEEPQELYLYD